MAQGPARRAALDPKLPGGRALQPKRRVSGHRHARAAVQALGAAVLAKLGKSERSGWEWLASKGRAKSSDYAAAMKVDERTARRHLNQFLKLDLVRKTGDSTSTEYLIK